MNHFDAFHWKDYSFASNHFWGAGAPVAATGAGGFDIRELQELETAVSRAQRIENNARAALVVAIAEEDWL